MHTQAFFKLFSPKYPGSLSIWGLLNAWLPPVIWAGSIFFLSSNGTLPGFDESIPDFIFKKSAHMFVYAGLYLLTHRALFLTVPTKSYIRSWKIAVFVCMIYACTDEFHQLLVPGRYGTLRDVGYDMLGVTTVLLKQHGYV